jgi:rubrerythrin
LIALDRVPPLIASADELMAMAHEIEEEAARRYRELAARMRLRGEERLCDLFLFLASIEEKHARHVAHLAAERLGHDVTAARTGWDVPESFDEEEGSSRLLTPYRALAVAVRNEDRAFAFYSYVAAGAADGATRALAEELAKDELTHAALLRRERRVAFREARERQPPIAFHLPASLDELWQLVAESEWHAACHHRALAAALGAGVPAAAFSAAAADEAEHAREAAARAGLALADAAGAPAATLDDGLRLLEAAFERYADIAERTGEADILREAQRMADAAVRRLTLVRGSIGNTLLEPGAATSLTRR